MALINFDKAIAYAKSKQVLALAYGNRSETLNSSNSSSKWTSTKEYAKIE